jgi:putative ABC transport system permease protein
VRDVLSLAWRYLAHHKIKTGILVASIGLIAFLPAGLNVLVGESAAELMARARATPLVLGAKGSALELVLSSLYFDARAPETVPNAEVEQLRATGLARAIPLHVGFRAAGHPIVGTDLAYLDWRGLRVADGRPMAVLGEAVLGAEVARALGLGPGDAVVSSPESVFDLAGVYPLKMRVAGVLAPAHTADDRAIFVDIKTAWVIGGQGHGHQDLAAPGAAATVMRRERGPAGERIVANASVREYNEITAENAASFHFHGDTGAFPITAVLAIPGSDKERALLRGRYAGPDATLQLVRPRDVIEDLLGTVFTVQGYVAGAFVLVGLATLATAALVFALSLRLRRREVETLRKIGGAPSRIAALLASEVLAVLVLAAALAGGLTLVTQRFGGALVRSVLLS